MPEFKIQCEYYGERKNKFFRDKSEEVYHKFCVINADDLPDEYFRSLWRGDLSNRDCWLWISNEISKKVVVNWEKGKDYCFIMNLGANKTAVFNVKDFRSFNSENSNAMVLKSRDYWENTVQKIGFWDSENYFYEAKTNPKKSNNNNQSQSENKNFWTKVAWICLPILFFFFCLFLFIKWINKKTKIIL